MNGNNLNFEKPILELEKRIEEIRHYTSDENISFSEEIKILEQRLERLKKEAFLNLSAWQRVLLARHPKRPYLLDYINMMTTDFVEFHGDRLFDDDKAIVSGLARIEGGRLLIVGHQKGRETKEKIERNFGSAHPEGYRKAMRLMRLAEKFHLPIVTFIDTPGAYPGIGAEERGQAEAIAVNLREMSLISVPIIVFVIGEGGSGGALGIGLGDKIYVLENSYYSVISPEGCAAILWKDRTKAPEAAEALKLTANDLLKAGIIDEVLPEPLGGAHREPQEMADRIKKAIVSSIDEFSKLSPDELIKRRYNKYRKIGVFGEQMKTPSGEETQS